MTDYLPESVSERLIANIYEVDEEESHIVIDQELAKATDAGKLLERVCPAHVYTAHEDGTVDIEYAACLECGTCLAVAPPGVLKWRYPRSMMGISYREG
ncbi:MAG: ferredoxin family protein [Varibaculum cambriense]